MEAENKELRARLEALEKKEGEGVQGGQGFHQGEKAAWKKSGVWKDLVEKVQRKDCKLPYGEEESG